MTKLRRAIRAIDPILIWCGVFACLLVAAVMIAAL